MVVDSDDHSEDDSDGSDSFISIETATNGYITNAKEGDD